MGVGLIEACHAFGITTSGVILGNGHINSTFFAKKGEDDYVLQLINTNVFKNPIDMISNIIKVTNHIKNKIKEEGGDPQRGVINFLKSNEGSYVFCAPTGEAYRAYRFIDDSVSLEGNATPDEFYQAGVGFGRFQKYLADFPVTELVEIIENFHNTPLRVEKLKKTIQEDKFDRVKTCQDVIEYVLKYEKDADIVTKGIESGEIPLRVTHNDTKLNNILFDKNTKEAICVIDLDTVMPGSMLYDFGDAIRYGASTAAEDEVDLDKVSVDLELFESFARGFISQLKDSITKREAELMAFSAKLMTYELVVRFLDDYLSGDCYFKTQYTGHNMIRARNQMKICQDMDLKMDKMKEIIEEILK